MINECSSLAYQEIVKSGYLGKQQRRVLLVFINEGKPLTADEVILLLKDERKKTNDSSFKRISELVDMGFLAKHDIIKSQFTKKRVNRWQYTGRTSPYWQHEVQKDCPHCQGTGKVWCKEYVKSEEIQPTFL